MTWVIIIVVVVVFIVWKFSNDTKNVQRRNKSLGGMKRLFPAFVEYFESNGFEFVTDTGTNLVYKKALTNHRPFDKFLFLGIESKFTDIAYGYIITILR